MNTTVQEYKTILEGFLEAWNRSDASSVASFYSEDCEYKDPNVPEGIFGKPALKRYLMLLFRRFPYQDWVLTELYPHSESGSFSACYRFTFANPKKGLEFKGTGMDRIELEDGKVKLNWVFLNAEKWRNWIQEEERLATSKSA
ncbi:hypothetical protein CH373_06370 [Leptospira perolatii]|uniref:SnoaL-like domain-containing protein n=1 Tax=Leptospira perolatii TaxID=2023191 RepID=A0A2M9ZP60_9LEPT|nr:nuclear transport factor 2 family protein [Leptospira perolatii]PJZ70885.1 hypothetical protein CH360_05100 [Leptospira perolatii]PJZ73781.1 hypothetical protein CH373_06370 [Leptospira perolatii]